LNVEYVRASKDQLFHLVSICKHGVVSTRQRPRRRTTGLRKHSKIIRDGRSNSQLSSALWKGIQQANKESM